MVNKSILDNGVRVISQQIPHACSVSVGIWVASGSRHEPPAVNGVSHFIEHMLFKGTERRSALDIAREIDSVGGVLNAFTGREFVCYYAKVLDKFLPKAVDLLADIFLHSQFDAGELAKEKQVILQEIRMLEDNPDDFIHDLFHQNVWAGHPLGMPIIGREESVEGLSRDFLVAYQAEKYRAEEIIVTAAGQLEHQELLGLLGEVFARIPGGNGKEGYRFPGYEKRIDIVQRDLEQVLICLGTKALPQNHPRRFESYILNTVLGGGMSSRLFQEIREKQGLAYSVYSYLASHTDAGTLVVSAGTSPEKYRQVIEIVLAELRKLKEEPLAAVELDAAREQLKGNILLSLESSDNRMSKLAKNEIYFGAYQPLDQLMAGFDAVTAESLLQLSRELLDDRSLTLQLMGNVVPQAISHADLVL